MPTSPARAPKYGHTACETLGEWHSTLKNPNRLFVTDVGEVTREEVSIATAGANLGWPLCEGDVCRDNADMSKLTPPAVAYGRYVGCAITDGVTVPWLDDGFIFGDLCSRRVYLLERDSPPARAQTDPQDNAQPWRMREIADLSALARNIIAFSAAAEGSVYVLSRNGAILRLHSDLVK